jgi:hypothetical protein
MSGGDPGDGTARGAGPGAPPRGGPGISSRTAPPQAHPDQPEPAAAALPRPADSAPIRAGHRADDGDPFDARDPDASAGHATLTGIDLIKRELGGQILGETDNA